MRTIQQVVFAMSMAASAPAVLDAFSVTSMRFALRHVREVSAMLHESAKLRPLASRPSITHRKRCAPGFACALAATTGEEGDSSGPTSAPTPENERDGPAAGISRPLGAGGADPDDLLVDLVGQDYSMMTLLRNDKFKSLIVLLRNIPPDEWVTAVEEEYPDDDEVKDMLSKVGKLMGMIDYYQAKQPKK